MAGSTKRFNNILLHGLGEETYIYVYFFFISVFLWPYSYKKYINAATAGFRSADRKIEAGGSEERFRGSFPQRLRTWILFNTFLGLSSVGAGEGVEGFIDWQASGSTRHCAGCNRFYLKAFTLRVKPCIGPVGRRLGGRAPHTLISTPQLSHSSSPNPVFIPAPLFPGLYLIFQLFSGRHPFQNTSYVDPFSQFAAYLGSDFDPSF